jgi:hypothetical protein
MESYQTTRYFSAADLSPNQWRTEGVGGFKLPLPEIPNFDKAEPNFQFRGTYIRNNLIRIRVSLICKLSGTPDYRPQIPVLYALCPQLNFLNPPTKKIPRYATGPNDYSPP